MRLSDLLDALPKELAVLESTSTDSARLQIIRGIRYDSRQISPGDLFVALRGANSDGHHFIECAVQSGAAALLVEEMPEAALRAEVPAFVVPDCRRALAPLAEAFFGQPADELTLIGVTGTNGKTSTTYIVESILTQAGKRTGLVGTVEVRYAGEREVAVNTTPESLDLQRMLRSMVNAHVDATVMEVSSHGLELGRVSGCRFKVAAFTNLSQDHLDFHGSMDAYLASKSRLFRDHLAPNATAVINIDDSASEKMIDIARETGAQILTVGRGEDSQADLRLISSEVGLNGTQALLEDQAGRIEIELPLLGDFNLENLLVAVGIARALGIDSETIARGVALCPQVPGRMERVVGTGISEPTVLVDYAHTPDAVDKLLSAVRPLCKGRLIAVFGCGGDRDRAKRPLMAQAVTRHADIAIATSDNPRTEDPASILLDVEAGLAGLVKVDADRLFSSNGQFAAMLDRRQAIETAILGADPTDTVVLAGKGHEDYQIIGREKFPFDDRLEARRVLIDRGAR